MIIRSIKLINYRQYKSTKIEFSVDPDKNITVVIGDNTSGKTTLVNAFLWGLYKTNDWDDKILLNREVARSMIPGSSAETKVVIELDHKDASYTITTKEEYYCSLTGDIRVKTKASSHVVKSTPDGTYVIPSIKVDDEINSILSPSLKEYFFFDGEHNSIESVGKKKNLTESVSDLMGLKRLEQLKEYYDPNKSESVVQRLKNKLVSTDDAKLNFYNEQLADNQEKLEKMKGELESLDKEIENLNEQLQDKEDQIEANKDVKDDQEKKKFLVSDIAKKRKFRDDQFNLLINSINSSNALLKVLFGKSFIENNLEELLKSTSFKSENSLKFISEEAIDLLIKRGVCLCGTCIKDNQTIIDRLLSEKEHMEPRDFGKYASDFSDAEKNNIVYASSITDNINDIADKLIDCVTEIDNEKESLKEIEKRIAGRTDVGALQIDAIGISRQIESKKGRRTYIENNAMPDLESDIESLSSKIETLTSKTSGNEFTQKCIDYAQYIFERASTQINNNKKEIKDRLEEVVNQIFTEMFHGRRKIRIDNNFKAEAVLMDGESLEANPGLESVKNFAFVTGLMKLVKERIISDDDVDEESEEVDYPLVMDAPFSKTDEKHISRICNVLPRHCNQVIIVVMRKDFESAKSSIKDKIGKEYVIVKKGSGETHSDIEEVL